jgi:hypothetical protein
MEDMDIRVGSGEWAAGLHSPWNEGAFGTSRLAIAVVGVSAGGGGLACRDRDALHRVRPGIIG